MTFDEWFHKEYEPADLQIKQCAERKESIQVSAKVYLEDLKKAFLAGLKAGKDMNVATKWHDLRKDSNDLPKVNQKVLLKIKDEDEPITDFYTQNNIWNFANKYEAIAWCEIPTFSDKE